MEHGWKTTHYSAYSPFGLGCRQDYLLFIASRKRLPVSVAVQIILPAKWRVLDINQHSLAIIQFCAASGFFAQRKGARWNKRLRVSRVIHFISDFPLIGNGLFKFPHWNPSRRTSVVYTVESGINSFDATFKAFQRPAHLFPTAWFKSSVPAKTSNFCPRLFQFHLSYGQKPD
jgi:hypothetical protein